MPDVEAPAAGGRPTDERRLPSRRVRVIGTVLAVLVTAVIVAYPIAIALLFVVVEWTGCFIECREPDPNPLGAVASGLAAVVLLALPVVVGVLSWRGSSRRLLLVFGGLVLLTAAMWVLGVAI